MNDSHQPAQTDQPAALSAEAITCHAQSSADLEDEGKISASQSDLCACLYNLFQETVLPSM